ncbi:MAG: sulfurtransferase TusA family protein, partial [Pseudomonadota bacterium]|nr:sulfurtransferase TusA family protein [Pseudomonadota bacterium]MEC8309248.1 sulfurtransferase TusA family protein [Pseudomonadota bacterium]
MDGVTDDQISVSLDLTGLKCPLPVLKARRQIGQMTSGILEVKADDPAA